MHRRIPPWRLLAALLGLLILAFGLRVAGLETQSIWVDEGFSVDFSSQSASCMTAMWKARGGYGVVPDQAATCDTKGPLAIAVDIHPPLYYLLLHEWMPLAGRGEYAVRFPSVMVGVLLVLLLYKLGASLASFGVGLAAAGMGTIAPFYIAYSQEARMYAPVALFSGLSLYFTWLILRRRSRRLWPWIGLVVCGALALYTHYSAVLVVGAENLLVAGVLAWRMAHRKPFVRLAAVWAGAQLCQLALFFPWLRTTIGQVAKYNENLWVPNWRLEMSETFRAFDAGMWMPSGESLRLAIPVSVILLAGCAVAVLGWGRRRSRDAPAPLPLMAGGAGEHGTTVLCHPERRAKGLLPGRAGSWLGPPPAFRAALLFGGAALLLELALALIAFQIRPEFSPRYLIVLATPYYVLLGLALAALWRRWWPVGLLAGAGLAAIFAAGLWGYEFDPNFAKDDTRTLAQYLAGRTTANDVIFLDAPEPLGYYYHGPAKLVSIPGDPATVAQAMTLNAAGKKRIVFVQWFVSTSDPEQLVPFLLQKYGKLVDDKGFRGYRERTYAIPDDTAFKLSPTDHLENADFGGIFRLEGAGFGPSAGGTAVLLPKLSQPVALSGSPLLLALKWRLLKPVSRDYKATVYLTDEHGHLAGQADLLLRLDQATSSRWPAGAKSVNYYVLDTPAGLMPGRYNVNVAVYPDGQQERLSVLDAAGAPGGGSGVIGSVDVLPPTQPVALSGPLNAPVAPGVNLLSAAVTPGSVAQGDPLHLDLLWKATARPAAGLKTVVALQQDRQSAPAWQAALAPAFDTGQWRPGDAFRDFEDPVLPPRLAPGAYRVLVGLGGALTPVGQVQVLQRQRSFVVPKPQHALSASLDGSIELLGYDTDRQTYAPGSTAKVTLYWRDVAPMDASYTAFLHVLDAGRHVVAQVDAVPDHGQAPTNAWLPGEVVQDTYELRLKPDLPAGSYELEVGFYRGDTGVRLKASSPDVRVIDNGVLIGPLAVTK